MANISPYFAKDFSAGMVTNINENIAPPNSVALAVNLDFDEEIGSAVSRLGTLIVNAQVEAGKTCLGLINFRDADGSNHRLIAFFNNSGDTQAVGYNVETGGTITGLTTQTADTKHRQIVFLDSVLIVNGTDAPKSYDGSTVLTTGGAFDLANIPFSEPSLTIEWLDRVYLAGDSANPDRVYYSSTPVSGAISWTSDNGYIDIEPEDGGGGITAFGKVPGFLIIFKERSMKRWNFDSAFPESLINIGTPSQESVISEGGLCAFYSASNVHAKGFYLTNGGRPIPISHDRARGIKKWVDAIPQANEADICGIGTDRVFMWSVGTLTVDDTTYNNVVLRYNRVLDQWSVRTYPQRIHWFSTFVNSSGENVIVGGDNDGNVIEIDSPDTYVDHSNQPIFYSLHLQEEKFGYNQTKSVSEKILWDTKHAEDARSVVIADGIRQNMRHESSFIGRLLEYLQNGKLFGRYFTFGIEGQVSGARAVIKECEVGNITVNRNTTQ